ncbi:N-acetylneuraminate synthase family protein [Rheinheimera maricola]|uniref:N-acetylneuraminate synthase family protein n=1 Tax=Rheinheimera maricola TaxID=2793282 RepID=A0ABS7X4I3_9GAMM|nr:N-acetylneuraminate synthase family protein [Rheinheimera maricola]MBZ9610221.1 N-acetylneuraminate synthase family protein [Rheinheimera maricola]
MKPVQIIAEIGSNHNGSVDIAKQYIDASKASGADWVKLQTLTKPQLMSPKTLIDGAVQPYPIWNIFNCNPLSDQAHAELFSYAQQQDIALFSAPFYLEAVDLLERMQVSQYKIASGDIAFFPLLDKVGATKKRVILSTGASDLLDVEKAVRRLTDAGCPEIVLLHCVSNYPPVWDEINLKAMTTLQTEFGTAVGISDHTPGALLPIAAVAMGASYIEKHVTFDRRLNGPDHPFAMTFAEFSDMIAQIRILEKALGNGIKVPTTSETEKQWRIRRGTYDPISLEPSTAENAIWLRPDYRMKG